MAVEINKVYAVNGLDFRNKIEPDFVWTNNDGTFDNGWVARILPPHVLLVDIRFKGQIDLFLKLANEFFGLNRHQYIKKRNEMMNKYKPQPLEKYIIETCDNLDAFITAVIDGDKFRNQQDPLFVLGGNRFAYPKTHGKYLTVEKRVTKPERPCIWLHEGIEAIVMRDQHLKYRPAHNNAEREEKELRKELFGQKYVSRHISWEEICEIFKPQNLGNYDV